MVILNTLNKEGTETEFFLVKIEKLSGNAYNIFIVVNSETFKSFLSNCFIKSSSPGKGK